MPKIDRRRFELFLPRLPRGPDFKKALGAKSVKALIEIVKLGAQKTISRPDGVVALYIVSAAASEDESAYNASSDVWKPECLEAYAAAAAISKLPDDCARHITPKSLELIFAMDKILDKEESTSQSHDLAGIASRLCNAKISSRCN